MPDTPAERAKRYRAHKRGDHTLCDASRCREARTVTVAPERDTPSAAVTPVVPVTAAAVSAPPQVVTAPPLGDDNDQDGIETVVRAYVDSLGHPAGDPRAILGEVAVRLARRVDRSGALPAAVRELRVLLAQLADNPTGPAGKVDDLRVQRAQRRLDALLANVA
ncbi:hypothetical protein [Micromonospora aurantiaca (nom. illeg.)]|uniref:hypothetical protein n=1 Tax=Micromonospora aurantiaca (nom. illeg.) TaxID=47850 RepID=UPI0033C1C764